jgi:hypothetical protein
MTREEIDRLWALCEAATPGPWNHHAVANVAHFQEFAGQWMVWHGADKDGDGASQLCGYQGPPMSEADCAFIAAARSAIPLLLDDQEHLWRLLKRNG